MDVEASTDYAANGDYSVKLTRNSTSDSAWIRFAVSSLSEYVGKTVTASVKAYTPSGSITFYLNLLNSTGDVLSAASVAVIKNSEFTPNSLSIMVPEDTASIRLGINVGNRDLAYIDDFILIIQ